MSEENGRHVVVTTAHRGVFFGAYDDRDGDEVTLKNARNCVYWSAQTRGFLGLAVTGPLDGSRIGPKVPSITLTAVTSITDCTDDAVERWEAAPWS